MNSEHSGFTSFHTPAFSFSNGHELYHSVLSYPPIRLCSPSSSSSLPFLNHRLYHLLSASAMSTSTSIAPAITQERYANNLHTLAQTKPLCPPHPRLLFFTAAKTGAGMSEVFEYVACRMAMRWEWEEVDIHVYAPDFVGKYSAVHISDAMTGTKRSFWPACCSL